MEALFRYPADLKRIPEDKSDDEPLSHFNVGVSASKGLLPTMEDTHSLVLFGKVHYDPCDDSERPAKRQKTEIYSDVANGTQESDLVTQVSFFTVCDGHGGVEAADFVNENLFTNVVQRMCNNMDTKAAILKGFEETEKGFATYSKERDIDGMVGTAVTAVLIQGNSLYVANLGDTEAVICSKGKEVLLTEVHIPNNPNEIKRVEEEGGTIISDRRGTKRLAHPVWNPRLVNIGVTRAIGDFFFKGEEYIGSKKSGLIATPSIVEWELTSDDTFLLLASDGFWEVVSHEEGVRFVCQNLELSSSEICQKLLQLSKSRNVRDNVTVLLIKFALDGTCKNSVDGL